MTLPDRREGWTRLHPLTVLKEVGSLAWALVALFLLDFEPVPMPGEFVDAEAVAAVLVFGYAVTRYLFTAYRITDRTLELRRGVVVKSFQSMPRDRVHSVGTSTGFLGRLVGVTTVEISAADAEDIHLGFVSELDADALRRVLQRDLPTGGPAEGEPTARPLSILGFRGLVEYGLTETSLLAAVPALGMSIVAAVVLRWYFAPLSVAFLIVWPLTTTAGLVGFRSWIDGDRVRSEAGILGRRRSEAPTGRIQVVQVSRPPLRRWRHRETVSIVTGDIGISTERVQLAGTVAPLVPVGEWRSVAEAILGPIALDERDLLRSSRLTIRRTMVRGTAAVLVLAGLATLAQLPLQGGWWAPAAVLLVGLAVTALYARARWRVLGHVCDDRHLLVRRGVFLRRLTVVPVHKVQDVTVRATFFQRRLGVATVQVDTAGILLAGQVLAVDLEEDRARRLADRLAGAAAQIALPDGV